ncbi:hypothetical protein [Microbacterium hatanonis]|jgi:hypothetical protein|uniref:PH domain-containing protein n=1 Tax=Microbacterium hatanonis TaxID=404366 RepID=A0A5C8I4E8_9MICO|nr:hypothetical protein [Microbacterium hatanonis]TXK13000.1 hypothetical protein FVP77_06035 [Microbacterium hatanonis]
MTREALLTIMIGLALLCLGLLAWSWWRRARRDAAYPAPFGELPEGARTTATFTTLYVATTRHGEPLERLAIRGLGFRSRADVTVTDKGIALDLAGKPRMTITPDRLVDAAQATVAIDRVVERDGLTRITWRVSPDTLVDSYIRPQEASARQLADAIRPLLPTGNA